MRWKFSSEDGQSVIFNDQLPLWDIFKAGVEQTTIYIPSHFREEYFNPAMYALARTLQQPDFDASCVPYCAFNMEGTRMWWEGFQNDADKVPAI